MDQFGGRQTEAAYFAHTPPKREGRITRKRSQEQICRKRESTYLYQSHDCRKTVVAYLGQQWIHPFQVWETGEIAIRRAKR